MTVPFGHTGWEVWQSAALRAPGFPATGLDRLSAPECARIADRYLGNGIGRADFLAAFDTATFRMTTQLGEIATEPLFREAVGWQSLNSVEALDGIVRTGPNASRNSRQRQREIVITRYWQRYCGKNDTIGFFGPVCWASFAQDSAAVSVKPGPELIRERVVDLEWRALTAYADRLAADPRYRRLLPVRRQPQLALDGNNLLQVGAPPRQLTPAAVALLTAADGKRSATEVAALAMADSGAGLRSEDDAFLALEQLAEQGILRWGLDLPLTIAAEECLREALATLGGQAVAGFERLSAARDGLAHAKGDSDAVREAMFLLQDEFVAITDGQIQHRPGATYAGRGLAYEETLRDLDVVFGQPVLSMLAPTLVPLLQAARWLTAAMAEAFTTALREIHEEQPLGDVFHLALGLIFGAGPVADVLDDFVLRWSQVLGLDEGKSRITLDSADVAKAVADLFPAEAPGWSAGRLHSPDLHLCAESAEALARGDFTAVLGELHVAWLTCNGGYLTRFHPDPDALRKAVQRDLGDRVILLYPPDFPEFTARIAFTLDGPGDVRLAYTDAPSPHPEQVLPLAAITLSTVDGELVGRAPDGRSWPVQELFGPFLSSRSVDAFKIVAAGAHTPRVTIDRLVVHRETWRTTVGDCSLTGKRIEEADGYLAVRRWRERLGLPERVFVRVGTEIKPCYVDLTSPAYVAAFVAMVRSAQRAGGDGVPLVVSEMLPTPDQAWVPDAAGNRYFSELRMAVRDPMPARTANWRGPR